MYCEGTTLLQKTLKLVICDWKSCTQNCYYLWQFYYLTELPLNSTFAWRHHFDYKYQNLSGFACLMLIRAIVIFYLTGNTKFKYETKNKLDCGSCSRMTRSWKLPIEERHGKKASLLILSTSCFFCGILYLCCPLIILCWYLTLNLFLSQGLWKHPWSNPILPNSTETKT